MNSSRLTLTLAAALLCSLAAMAIPADDTPQPCAQPDGTTVMLRLCGDEFYNFHTTVDGYTVVRDATGAWCYATRQGGDLVSTGVVAHDATRRTPSEQSQTALLQRGLTSPRGVAKARAARAERDKRLNIVTPQEMAARAGDGRRRMTGVSMDRDKFRGLIILINYSDVKFSTMSSPQSFYQSMVNQTGYSGFTYNGTKYTAQGSMRDYFRYQSNSAFAPQFDVYGPVNLSYSSTYVQQTDYARRNTLFEAALTALDSSINYATYDSDNNGEVDMVYFIVAGYTSDYENNDENLLWPHAGWLANSEGTNYLYHDGKRFGRYACSGEIYGWQKYNDPFPLGIGTMCHEFSHVLGLPDLYDTDYSENGQSLTPGHWDVMASGSGRYDKGRTPVNYSAWERDNVGFASMTTISSPGSYTLRPGEYESYRLNSANSNEYFTLENRQRVGWDTYLPGHGMLVCRVDESNNVPWDDNDVNINPTRVYYELLRAGGSTDVDAQSGSDPFPGTAGVTSITSTTTPALVTWDGKQGERKITNIKESGAVITFNIEAETHYQITDDIAYTLINDATEPYLRVDGLSVIGKAKSNLDLVIPSVATYKGAQYPVREIKAQAFYTAENITSVTIRWGCRSIGDFAFYKNTAMTYAKIPSSVNIIGMNAFYNCYKLQSVYYAGFNLPTVIGTDAFSTISGPVSGSVFYYVPCAAFTTSDLSSKLGSYFTSFAKSNSAADYHITDGSYFCIGADDNLKISDVHDGTLVGWVKPSSNTDGVFTPTYHGFFNVEGVDIKIRTVASGAVTKNTDLTDLNLDGCYITRIGNGAFDGCSNLATVTLNEGLTTIEAFAFRGSTITTIHVPASVTSLSAYFVDQCAKHQTITVDEGNTAYASHNGMLFNKSLTTLLRKPCYGGGATYPATMTAIGAYAYEGCSRMSSVTVPYGVTYIGTAAFNSCSNLSKLIIPSSVKSLGANFVRNCNALSQLYINLATPPTVSDVNTYFGTTTPGNINLHVPYSAKSTYESASGWQGFKSYNLNNEFAYDGALGVNNINGGRFTITSTAPYGYTDTAGNSRTASGGTAMYQGSGDGVTTLTGDANLPTGFNYRDKYYLITEVAPYTLTGGSGTAYAVGGGAFLTTIDEFAFHNCKTISSLTIKGPLSSVGEDAFTGMSNCAEVMLESDNDLSASFAYRIYGDLKSGYLFWINNKFYYACYQKTRNWSAAGTDTSMKNRLRPFLKPAAEVEPFSCYMDYVDLNNSGLLEGGAYWITGYNEATKTLTTTRATAGQSNLWSKGMLLTGLTPGKIYKLQFGTSNYYGNTSYLEPTANGVRTLQATAGFHVWDAAGKMFVKPTSTVTVPICTGYLNLPASQRDVTPWTVDVLGNKFDVNNDGSVDVGDVNAVLAAILAAGNDAKFNVNGDTAVDVGDVNAILDYILTH